MDSVSAYVMCMMHADSKQMVFDWHKAARIIKERQGETASAGLRGDWEYTGGVIWINGAPLLGEETEWLYLSSPWAIPELAIGNDIYPCWLYLEDSPGWHEKTIWPQSALDVIGWVPPALSAPAAAQLEQKD